MSMSPTQTGGFLRGRRVTNGYPSILFFRNSPLPPPYESVPGPCPAFLLSLVFASGPFHLADKYLPSTYSVPEVPGVPQGRR